MHSAWNSWPHGRLMTRLTPSTYSSRHTTHSTWRPLNFFHSRECRWSARDGGDARPPLPLFAGGVQEDWMAARAAAAVGGGAAAEPLSGTPVVVRERGRDRGDRLGRLAWCGNDGC